MEIRVKNHFLSNNNKEGGNQLADKILRCKDCNAEFAFTDGEQAFYKEKGFENEPQRCPDCRKQRKQQRDNSGGDRYSSGNNNNRW